MSMLVPITDKKILNYKKRFKSYKTIFLFVSKITNRSFLREDREALKLRGLTLKKLNNFPAATLFDKYSLLRAAARSIKGYSFLAVSIKKKAIGFITDIFNLDYAGLRPYFAITNKTIFKITRPRHAIIPNLFRSSQFIFLLNSVIGFLYLRLKLHKIS